MSDFSGSAAHSQTVKGKTDYTRGRGFGVCALQYHELHLYMILTVTLSLSVYT